MLATGSVAFDYILTFNGRFRDHIMPDQVHILNLSFLVDRFERRRGGVAANYAYTLALLGQPSAILATAGADAAEYREWLEGLGVECSGLKLLAGETTATGFTTTDLDDNQITGYYGGAMNRAGEVGLADTAVQAGCGHRRAERTGGHGAAGRRVPEGGHPLRLRPRPPAAAHVEGGPRGGLPRGLDPDRQRLRAGADPAADRPWGRAAPGARLDGRHHPRPGGLTDRVGGGPGRDPAGAGSPRGRSDRRRGRLSGRGWSPPCSAAYRRPRPAGSPRSRPPTSSSRGARSSTATRWPSSPTATARPSGPPSRRPSRPAEAGGPRPPSRPARGASGRWGGRGSGPPPRPP